MSTFVHLAPAAHAHRIRRGGIRGARVFCMPVLPSYALTHQWVRELRRWKAGVLVAVDFRIPDDTPVLVGRYSAEPSPVTAAQAVATIRDLADPRGWEVVVGRTVTPGEIRRIRPVSQGIGWRHLPDAHGRRPCACPMCLAPGTPGAAAVRRRFGDGPRSTKPELMARLRAAEDPDDLVLALGNLGGRSRGGAEDLAYLADHPDPEVREALFDVLKHYRGRAARDLRIRLAPTLPEADEDGRRL